MLLDLIGNVPQSRRTKPEAKDVYAAIRWLRMCGHTVFRAGNQVAYLDGRRIYVRFLLPIALETEPRRCPKCGGRMKAAADYTWECVGKPPKPGFVVDGPCGFAMTMPQELCDA